MEAQIWKIWHEHQERNYMVKERLLGAAAEKVNDLDNKVAGNGK
jgi:hypothetical protein